MEQVWKELNTLILARTACRGDDRAIVCVTLISHGAEVKIRDVQQHSGTVGHAGDTNYATCVRLMLEDGARAMIATCMHCTSTAFGLQFASGRSHKI